MLLWLLPGPLAWDLTTLAITTTTTTTTTTTATTTTTTKRRQRLLAICFELDIRLYLRTSIEGCLAGVKVVCALPIDSSTYLYRNLFMYIHTYIYIIFIISVYIVYNVAASHDNDSQFVAVVVVTKQTNVCPQSTSTSLLGLRLLAANLLPFSLSFSCWRWRQRRRRRWRFALAATPSSPSLGWFGHVTCCMKQLVVVVAVVVLL